MRPVERRRPPQAVDVEHRVRDWDLGLLAHLLEDELHREERSERVRADGLACARVQRGLRRARHVGLDVVPAARKRRFLEQELRLRRLAGHRLSIGLGVFDLDGEAGESPDDGAVELVLVLLRRLLVEGRCKVVAEAGEQLRPRLNQAEVVAVELFGLVARRRVVGRFRRVTVGDQLGLLLLEELELAPDDVPEAAARQRSSR